MQVGVTSGVDSAYPGRVFPIADPLLGGASRLLLQAVTPFWYSLEREFAREGFVKSKILPVRIVHFIEKLSIIGGSKKTA